MSSRVIISAVGGIPVNLQRGSRKSAESKRAIVRNKRSNRQRRGVHDFIRDEEASWPESVLHQKCGNPTRISTSNIAQECEADGSETDVERSLKLGLHPGPCAYPIRKSRKSPPRHHVQIYCGVHRGVVEGSGRS